MARAGVTFKRDNTDAAVTYVRLLRHKHFGATNMLGDVAHCLVRIVLLLTGLHDVRIVRQSEPYHAREHNPGVEFS